MSKDPYRQRLSSLKAHRNQFDTHWRAIAASLAPNRQRFDKGDANDGRENYSAMVDSEVVRARRAFVAGFTAGLTSQSRPWRRLETQDPALMENHEVREFLEMVNERMETVFQRGNLYQALMNVYDDLGTFGTACLSTRESDDAILRFYHRPIGEFYTTSDEHGTPDTLYAEVQRTAEQIVRQFGIENVSSRVRSAVEQNRGEELHEVVEVIQPNIDALPGYKDVANMAYKGCYFEQTTETGLLGEVGFNEKPDLVCRWSASTSDAYGTDCPGMLALADNRQLQHQTMRKAEGIDRQVRPTFAVPSSFEDDIDLMPGAINFYDEGAGGRNTAEAIIDGRYIKLDWLAADIEQVRERLRSAFLVDMFLMLEQLDKRDMTAFEVDKRYEEKMLMLGPTIIHVVNELLSPLIDRTFAAMIREGMILPEEIPDALEGKELKVEYTSPLAQAQQSVGLAALERTINFATSLASIDPTAWDKIDTDQAVDEYARRSGAPVRLVRSDDDVSEVRKAKAEAAQMQEMAMAAQAANPASQALKNLNDIAGN